MSLTDAMLDAAIEENKISEVSEDIRKRLTKCGDIQFDYESVNDNGGFTAICKRSDCRAGVFASMDEVPLITIAVDLPDALPLIVGDPDAEYVTLEIRTPNWNRVHRILCKRACSQDGTPLLMFETELPHFTKMSENLCIWLITTLFKRAVSA